MDGCYVKKSRVLILGNGPIEGDHAATIDAFDRVVRFNFCAHMPTHLGVKCTDLWLVGRGRHALSLLQSSIETQLPDLKSVMITNPEPNPLGQLFFKLIQRQEKIDHSKRLYAKFSMASEHQRLTSTTRKMLLNELLELGKPQYKPKCPSSGLLAINHFLKDHQQVHIAGFGFKGWKRHPWQQEQKYVKQLIDDNRVIPFVESSVVFKTK